MNPNNPNFLTESEWEEKYYKLREEYEKLFDKLEIAKNALSKNAEDLACNCCDSADTVQKLFDKTLRKINKK